MPLVEELMRATEDQWILRLAAVRDGKGSVYTQALLMAIRRVAEDKAGAVRQALAERLARMTAETLRQYMKGEDPELRRAAVLAMAMKDDITLVPDLITALLDEEERVVRAARVGLKSLTGQDFGPLPGADLRARRAAAQAWLDWFRKQQR
jgi:HEAT repeat protein